MIVEAISPNYLKWFQVSLSRVSKNICLPHGKKKKNSFLMEVNGLEAPSLGHTAHSWPPQPRPALSPAPRLPGTSLLLQVRRPSTFLRSPAPATSSKWMQSPQTSFGDIIRSPHRHISADTNIPSLEAKKVQWEDISNFFRGTQLRDETRSLARSFDSKGTSQVAQW